MPRPPTNGSLFSGVGALDMAIELALGARTIWHADNDPDARRVLRHWWPRVPNLGDITRIDWHQVRRPTVLSGGSPCQDVSHAGPRLGMREGTRSGLWAKMVDGVDVLRPDLVVWENVQGALSSAADSGVEPCPGCVGGTGRPGAALRALGRVLGDLAGLGYDARWCCLPAAAVGAPHLRHRVFVAAHPARDPRRRGNRDGAGSAAAHPDGGQVWQQPVPVAGRGPATVAGQGHGAAADAERGRRRQRAPQPVRAPGGGAAAGRADGVDWGQYGPAVARWERILGRPAPAPAAPTGVNGGYQLTGAFDEWMMGLPAGHVTDPAIWTGVKPRTARNAQLRLCGNTVVVLQAVAALRLLTAPLPEAIA